MYIFTDACNIADQQLSEMATLRCTLFNWVKMVPKSALIDAHAALFNSRTVEWLVPGLCIRNCSVWLAM